MGKVILKQIPLSVTDTQNIVSLALLSYQSVNPFWPLSRQKPKKPDEKAKLK